MTFNDLIIPDRKPVSGYDTWFPLKPDCAEQLAGLLFMLGFVKPCGDEAPYADQYDVLFAQKDRTPAALSYNKEEGWEACERGLKNLLEGKNLKLEDVLEALDEPE